MQSCFIVFFLNLIRKHFPSGHRYCSLFNRNTLKLSYSCMENVGDIIKKHNAKLLAEQKSLQKSCNCRKKDSCPLKGDCQQKCVVYKAEVETKSDKKYYYGMSEGYFKLRFANHQKSFKNRTYENETALSKYVWKVRDKNEDFKINWSIEKKAFPYRCGSKNCDLCATEKLCIAMADQKSLLNNRTEIISRCPHRRKFTFNKPKKKTKVS